MESLFSKMSDGEFSGLSRSQSMVLMLSLDKSGETTLCKIKLGKEDVTTEMLESKVEKDISFTLKDIEDEEKVKQLWRQCNQETANETGSVLRWTISEFNDLCAIFYTYTPTIKRTKRCWSNLQCLEV